MARFTLFAAFAIFFNLSVSLLNLIGLFPSVTNEMIGNPSTIIGFLAQQTGCTLSENVPSSCAVSLFTIGIALIGVTFLTGGLTTMLVFGNTWWAILILVLGLSASMAQFYDIAVFGFNLFGSPPAVAAGIGAIISAVLLLSFSMSLVKVTAKVDLEE
jgi:hypothetical protein